MVAAFITAENTAKLFLNLVFGHHGLPSTIVSYRDTRFTASSWSRLFALLGSRIVMSTAAHPKTNRRTERSNRVLKDVMRSYVASFASWRAFLPMIRFTMINAGHASTELKPFSLTMLATRTLV